MYNKKGRFVKKALGKKEDGGDINKKWIADWYSKRKISDANLQGALDLDRKDILKNIENSTVTRVPFIDAEGKRDGETRGQSIFLTNDAKDDVDLHERDHAANAFSSYTRSTNESNISGNLRPKQKTSGIYKDNYDYYSNPDEVHARLMVLRQKAGFRPEQKVTKEELKKYFSTYKNDVDNINELRNIADDDGLLDILNWTTYKPNSNPTVAKKGGYISKPKMELGGSNYGMLPSGQLGYTPPIKKYSTGEMIPNGFIPSNTERMQDLMQPTPSYQNQQMTNGFGIPNLQNILGIGAVNFAAQSIANGIDSKRQNNYINNQNDPYSNLTPLSGQSYGAKYGYQKYGGILKKKADGGDIEGDDFDPTDFLWGDEGTSAPIVSESDVEKVLDKNSLRKQKRQLWNQQAMAIVDAPYTVNQKTDSNKRTYNPDTTTSYNENIAAGESGGDYMAKNPTSSAFGKYQFVKGTRLGTYNNSSNLKNLYRTTQDFENAFTGKLGPEQAVAAQEATMEEYTKAGSGIHKNDPVAMSLYHYAPKFAQMYMQGKLDLDKNAADYGVGKGTKNPTFRSFLKTHGFKDQFKKGGKV